MRTQPEPVPSPATRPFPAAGDRVNSSLAPISKGAFGFDEARHLLWRAGFGGTPAQIQTLATWGPEKSVDHLIKFSAVPTDAVTPETFDKEIMREPTPEERQAQRRAAQAKDEDMLAKFRLDRQKAEAEDRDQMRKIQQWWIKRLIETARPLEERMVLFWHGHFATSYRIIEDSYHMYQQNLLFRKNAVGNFGDLLYGIIRDPAMLKYLNNNQSQKNKPNENLAREIMELFSLGVGNYTEKDIKEGARALTGYTYRDDEFTYQKGNHDDGRKNILGQGANSGDDFVKIILDQPACAKYIVTKFYRYFVADYPSGRKNVDAAATQVINELAATFRSSKYDIGLTLRKLFLSQHFYEQALRNEQIKSPVQLVVGAIRSFNTPARSLADLNESMAKMGQEICYPPSVKGWDGGRSWINSATMFIRQNVLVYLISGRRPGGKDALADQEKFDPQALITQLADAYPEVTSGSPDAVVDAFLRYALGRTTPNGRQTLVDYIQANGGRLNAKTMTDLMLLITAMPEYQLC